MILESPLRLSLPLKVASYTGKRACQIRAEKSTQARSLSPLHLSGQLKQTAHIA